MSHHNAPPNPEVAAAVKKVLHVIQAVGILVLLWLYHEPLLNLF